MRTLCIFRNPASKYPRRLARSSTACPGEDAQKTLRQVSCRVTSSDPPVTDQESENNKRRWEESGMSGSVDHWRWTLNWDEITSNIVVGSCPRSPEDVIALVREAKVDAIICLQSDGCFEALKIDHESIRSAGTAQGIIMTRVAVWDFNHNDQALMLPEAVRKLAILVALGKRVYVHCTAGINRATLTVVGYLTFVQGWELNSALRHVKAKRAQAHPYLDCWKTVRRRLTEGRTEEVLGVASSIYHDRKTCDSDSGGSDDFADWVAAEGVLITELFQRQIQADLSLVMSLQDIEEVRRDDDSSVCISTDDYSSMQAEMGLLRGKLDKERMHTRAAMAELKAKTDENRRLREAQPRVAALLEDHQARELRVKEAEAEISALKNAIRDVAISTFHAVKSKGDKMPDHLVTPPSADTEVSTDAMKLPRIGAAPENGTDAATVPEVAEEQEKSSSGINAPDAAMDPHTAQQLQDLSVAVTENIGRPRVDIGSPHEDAAEYRGAESIPAALGAQMSTNEVIVDTDGPIVENKENDESGIVEGNVAVEGGTVLSSIAEDIHGDVEGQQTGEKDAGEKEKDGDAEGMQKEENDIVEEKQDCAAKGKQHHSRQEMPGGAGTH